MGITEVVSAPASPWQNPYVERLIGSIRRECLDHVIVLNASHLRRVLTIYREYYHRSRTHLGLAKDAPDHRPASEISAGPIVAIPEVGGLHHRTSAGQRRRTHLVLHIVSASETCHAWIAFRYRNGVSGSRHGSDAIEALLNFRAWNRNVNRSDVATIFPILFWRTSGSLYHGQA
jgi:hypothetical protein